MATYRFPEHHLHNIISHIPAYGLTILNLSPDPSHEGPKTMYLIELSESIPERELPHLIEGAGLEVL